MAIQLRINQICYPTNFNMAVVDVDSTDRNMAEEAMAEWADHDPELDGLVELQIVVDGVVTDTWEYQYESFVYDPCDYSDRML